MRVAIVRSDIGPVLLDDVESSSQRNFSSQPAGQSRYFKKPSDAQLLAVLTAVAPVTIQGSDTAATVDTTVANGTKLNIRDASGGAYVQVTVSSSATAAKTTIASELNIAFANAGLKLRARVGGSNKLTIDSTVGGPGAHIQISAGSPSTGALHTVLGLATTAVNGLTVSALKAAAYPSATTVDVSSATLLALGTFSLLATDAQSALVAGVADLVAPKLVETGMVLLSFAYGKLSKLKSASFQPGNTRAGLSAGVAAAIVADDGSTVYSL